MSTYIIGTQKVYVAHFDLTSYLDSVTIGGQKAAVAATALGATTELMKPGLETVNFSYGGFFDGPDGADEIHDYLLNHATPAATPPPFAVCPTTGADGELAMMHCGRDLSYDFGGAWIDVEGFGIGWRGCGQASARLRHDPESSIHL